MTSRRATSHAESSAKRSREDLFVCPECSGALEWQRENLSCPRCRQWWPIVNGIPHFVREFPYWGDFSQEMMRNVNRLAETGSWRDALVADPSVPLVQEKADLIQNLERANWHWLLPLPPASRVLDVGAGTGTLSHALAKRFREVVAVEPVLERAEFMRHRFAQEGIANIQIVRTSLWTLPFFPESFDLVTLNGVLEWVPEGRTGDPELLQAAALRRLFQLLRPGGYLYVGIENRLDLAYFAGSVDKHCRLAYIMLLPRPLAHWYGRRKGLVGGYRNYIYSSHGYRKLLRKAGFSEVQIYLALPHYNDPLFYIPLREDIFSYYARNLDYRVPSTRIKRLVYGILKRLGLLKYLQDSFAILARK